VTVIAPGYNATELERMLNELNPDALIDRSGRNVAYLSGMTFPVRLGHLLIATEREPESAAADASASAAACGESN
jgi:hypothetical protein